MADLSDFELINISGMPSGTAAGANFLAQDDGSNVTKITIDQAVAASQAMQQVNNKIGSTALPTTAQTLTGAIAEHESDLATLNSKFVPGQIGSDMSHSFSQTGTWELVGSITTTASCLVYITSTYNVRTIGIGINGSNTLNNGQPQRGYITCDTHIFRTPVFYLPAGTNYIWAKANTTGTSNAYAVYKYC